MYVRAGDLNLHIKIRERDKHCVAPTFFQRVFGVIRGAAAWQMTKNHKPLAKVGGDNEAADNELQNNSAIYIEDLQGLQPWKYCDMALIYVQYL